LSKNLVSFYTSTLIELIRIHGIKKVFKIILGLRKTLEEDSSKRVERNQNQSRTMKQAKT
jgi:hypothetical protein